ncbi:hypothetical protein [Alicyclobacillus sp. SO9]|uniref:hypothetical protein n=1 Tax=Alicyclobacillus sp. SO9 TaxID=2665646 RepID=UPI0018E7DF9F|nr:hypothetical protein [Alicyclobacillus sp. SO9]QQE77261.1 hypothetical protein GI364_14975 [Alicyclobacillus sp. SO9]
MKRILILLIVTVLTLSIFEVVFGGLWHIVGFNDSVSHLAVSFPEFLIRNVALPVLLTMLVARMKPPVSNKYWSLGAFLICLIPLLMSTSVGLYVAEFASGRYEDYQRQNILGLILSTYFGYIVTGTVLIASFKWKSMLPKFVVDRFWYGVVGFVLGTLVQIYVGAGRHELMRVVVFQIVMGVIISIVRRRKNLLMLVATGTIGPLFLWFGQVMWLVEMAAYHPPKF